MTLNPLQGYANKFIVRDAFRMCSSRRIVVFVIEESLFDRNINIIFVSNKMQWCENKRCLFNKNIFYFYRISQVALRDYKLGNDVFLLNHTTYFCLIFLRHILKHISEHMKTVRVIPTQFQICFDLNIIHIIVLILLSSSMPHRRIGVSGDRFSIHTLLDNIKRITLASLLSLSTDHITHWEYNLTYYTAIVVEFTLHNRL
ncbi:Uncharacterized protein FWK35_00010748 [Aphis craccivora]|uniref:Uncharacterized protein n=1 Tax=Aphis craccivora TaxID=307492 RepID=A0A6G0Z8W9_APHCR|nr:Uncharacterized protein FWK35_00010748 [Aphis craccivora]